MASEKRIYGDYFLGFSTRDVSGMGDVWRLYQEEESPDEMDDGPAFNPLQVGEGSVEIPGDLYLNADIKDICSTRYPLIGPYDLWDTDVCEYHVLLAKTAGLDGFMCEWSFEGMPRDTSMLTLAHQCARYGLECGANWCEYGHFTWRDFKTREDAVKAGQKAFQYLLEKIYSIAGPKLDGRPVVLMFDPHNFPEPVELKARGFAPKELAETRDYLRSQGHEPIIITRSTVPELTEVADGHYGWVDVRASDIGDDEIWDEKSTRADNVAMKYEFNQHMAQLKAEGRIKYSVGAICPGFDDHKGMAWGVGLKRHIESDEGQIIRDSFKAYRDGNHDFALIVTWNDWEEDSLIEPTLEHGYRDLDITAEEIADYKGTEPNKALLRVPYLLFRLRKSVKLMADAGMSEQQLAPLREKLDALGHTIAAGDTAASEAAATDAEALNAQLRAHIIETPIHAMWEYGLKNLGLTPTFDGAPTKVDINRVTGITLPGMPPRLGFRVTDALRATLTAGTYNLRLTVQYLDNDRDFVRARVDSEDKDHELIAMWRKKGSGQWRTDCMDLVNARFVGGLNDGADFAISQKVNTNGGIRLVRIDGVAYSVK